ncbi:hypothetical protein BJ138DRAFT_1116074 [Hygrophoropsis aurantiaca]|uniref:Uncharacterized protein n=1 Tax=Hygrophoropsis aurantiaca TaxID=72124 RepID=A0ACB8A533_9AGAM|nr:hypothetical protein BJ138DRAFT_1116074 [Hygrophoropsis aurantiaca]
METGGALGIVLIKYHSNEEAKRCERAHGKKLGAGIGSADGEQELKLNYGIDFRPDLPISTLERSLRKIALRSSSTAFTREETTASYHPLVVFDPRALARATITSLTRIRPSPSSRSRSPSPIARRPGHPSGRQQQQKQSTSTAVVEPLARNGFEHVRVDFGSGTPESTMGRGMLQTNDSARRAGMVLNSGARTLAHHSVTVTVCPPRSQVSTDKTSWTEEEMVHEAESIVRELKMSLDKDITERVIAVDIRKLVSDEKAKKPNKPEREVSTKVVGEDEHVEQEEEGNYRSP